MEHQTCTEASNKIPSAATIQHPLLWEEMLEINGLSWTLVRKMDLHLAGQNFEDLYLKANCNYMLVVAAKLMEESFKLIVDRQTRTNMIQSVIYSCGSNFPRTNLSRFYTAVLDYYGNIISVASLRLPSPVMAEIPFIATNENVRNIGMSGSYCKLVNQY